MPESRLRWVLIAASVALCMVQLDFFALNQSLPKMADDLDVSTVDLQWVISGYMLALAAFLIPGGRLGDILGRRRMLVAGICLFAGASTVCGLAPSPALIIGFRIVQGIGAAIMFPLCVGVVSNAFPAERRGRAIGNLYGLAAVATAVGPFFGGAITGALSWRYVFLVNLPVGLIAILLILRFVDESRDESVPRHIDTAGLAAIALGVAAITFAVDRAEDWGIGSLRLLALFAAGLALLFAFVAIERRARFPLVDLKLFSNRPYVLITVLGTIGNVVFVTTTFTAALYLQQVKGLSPVAAGAAFLPASVATSVMGPLSGRLGERFDIPRTMILALCLGAPGLVLVASGPALGPYMLGLIVFGGGYGLTWSMVSVGTQAVVPPEQTGGASGVTLAVVIGIAGLSVAASAAIVQAITHGGTTEGDAIQSVLLALVAGSVVLGLGLLAVTRRMPRIVTTAA